MNVNMDVFRIGLVALVATLTVATESYCGPGSSRSVLDAMCFATDIIVVTDGDVIDGEVTALEAWKGNIAVGSRISVPGLGAWQPDHARRITRIQFEAAKAEPQLVSCQRIVVFLVRGRSGFKPAYHPELGFELSACWIEGGEAYGYSPAIVPGPFYLMALGLTEAEFKRQIFTRPAEQDIPGDAAHLSGGGRPRGCKRSRGTSNLWVARP